MTETPLKDRLARNDILLAPGVYDGFSAGLAEAAGFEALYISGGSIAYSRFGRPDIGLVGMSEVADTLSVIRERVAVPLIIDADTGYGNALNVQRTVRLFERRGANVIQLEDQSLPKRCGHLSGKSLVSAAEMVGKVHAALDARENADTLIMARTDAIAVEGLEAALDRAERFLEAGADILFIEAPPDRDAMQTVCNQFKDRVPLLANMVEGGKTPLMPAADLQALGYSIAIFPGGLMRAIARTASDYFESLKTAGWTDPFKDRMLDITGLNALLGTPEILEEGKRYDAENFKDGKG